MAGRAKHGTLLLLVLLVAGLAQAQCSGHGDPLDGGGCDCYAGYTGAACDVQVHNNGCAYNVTSGEELLCVNLAPLDCDGAWAVELTVEYSGFGLLIGEWVNYGNSSVDGLCADLPSNIDWTQAGGPDSLPLFTLCLSFTDVYLDDTTVSANTTLTTTAYSTDYDTGYHAVLQTGTLQMGGLTGTNAPCGSDDYLYGACSVSWDDAPAVNGTALTWSEEDNCVYYDGWPAYCPVVYYSSCSADSGFLTTSEGVRLSVPLSGNGIAWDIDCVPGGTVCLTLSEIAFNGTAVTYSMVFTTSGDSVTYAAQSATFPACGDGQCFPYATSTTEDDGDGGDDDGADDDDMSNPNAGVYLAFLCFFIFLCALLMVVALGVVAYRMYMKKKMVQDTGYGLLNDGDGSKSLLEEMSDENDANEIEPDYSF